MEAAEPIVRRGRVRQFRTTEEKRLIVEETRRVGVSVSTVAQAHGVNANQVFYWRKLYEAGQLERTVAQSTGDLGARAGRLLSVSVDQGAEPPAPGAARVGVGARTGSHRGHGGCRYVAHGVTVSARMIAPPANTQIWIAADVTDMRRGFTGLSALVQTALEQAPLSGHVFAFRGRRGDLIKLLWFDGDGLCLFSKRLERGRFVWPQAESGKVSLTRAQLSMLLEGVDWGKPDRDLQTARCV